MAPTDERLDRPDGFVREATIGWKCSSSWSRQAAVRRSYARSARSSACTSTSWANSWTRSPPRRLAVYMARSARRSSSSCDASASAAARPILARTVNCLPRTWIGAASAERMRSAIASACAPSWSSSSSTANSSPPRRAAVSPGAGMRPSPGDPDQQLVPSVVAEPVVDQLQAVEVDEEHGHPPIATEVTAQGVAHAVGEQGAVGQPGQVVVESLVAKPRLGRQQQLVGVGVRGRDGRLVAQVGQQAVLVFGELPRASHGHERIGRRCPADQAGDRVHRRSWPRPARRAASARSSASPSADRCRSASPTGVCEAARTGAPEGRSPPGLGLERLPRGSDDTSSSASRSSRRDASPIRCTASFSRWRSRRSARVVVRRRDPARALRRHRGKQPHEREREQRGPRRDRHRAQRRQQADRRKRGVDGPYLHEHPNMQLRADAEDHQVVETRGGEVEDQLGAEREGDHGRPGRGGVAARESDEHDRGPERMGRIATRVNNAIPARPAGGGRGQGAEDEAGEHQRGHDLGRRQREERHQKQLGGHPVAGPWEVCARGHRVGDHQHDADRMNRGCGRGQPDQRRDPGERRGQQQLEVQLAASDRAPAIGPGRLEQALLGGLLLVPPPPR